MYHSLYKILPQRPASLLVTRMYHSSLKLFPEILAPPWGIMGLQTADKVRSLNILKGLTQSREILWQGRTNERNKDDDEAVTYVKNTKAKKTKVRKRPIYK
jgi:hypothetical protein